MKLFAKNIYYLRKQAGYTQAEMPDRLSVSRTTWSNYENGVSEPNSEGFISIANLFGVSLDDLLTKDLSVNVHLNEKQVEFEKRKNVHLNVHPSVHPKGEKATFTQEDRPLPMVAETGPVYDADLLKDEISKMRQELDIVKKKLGLSTD